MNRHGTQTRGIRPRPGAQTRVGGLLLILALTLVGCTQVVVVPAPRQLIPDPLDKVSGARPHRTFPPVTRAFEYETDRSR